MLPDFLDACGKLEDGLGFKTTVKDNDFGNLGDRTGKGACFIKDKDINPAAKLKITASLNKYPPACAIAHGGAHGHRG